jgi:hypothetical protein
VSDSAPAAPATVAAAAEHVQNQCPQSQTGEAVEAVEDGNEQIGDRFQKAYGDVSVAHCIPDNLLR